MSLPAPIYEIGKKVRHHISALVALSSRIGDEPTYAASHFPWIAEIESRWTEIQAELKAVLAREAGIPPLASISPDHRQIAPAGKWKSFFLYGYGYRVDENCRRCPVTTELVERIPGLNSAFFSILAPGTHIPRHRGVTKAILTAHLGLIVPENGRSCRMQVADEFVHWQEGRTLVFDDTYPHEVWNDTKEQRVVLLVQFRRPVGWLGKLVSEAFLSGIRRTPFVQDARAEIGHWERVMQRLETSGRG